MSLPLHWTDDGLPMGMLFTAPLVPFFMMLVGWGAEAAGRAQLWRQVRGALWLIGFFVLVLLERGRAGARPNWGLWLGHAGALLVLPALYHWAHRKEEEHNLAAL